MTITKAEDAYARGYLDGCESGNRYMQAVDKELSGLRTRVEMLEAACDVERKRAERAEAQTLTIAEENLAMVRILKAIKQMFKDVLRFT